MRYRIRRDDKEKGTVFKFSEQQPIVKLIFSRRGGKWVVKFRYRHRFLTHEAEKEFDVISTDCARREDGFITRQNRPIIRLGAPKMTAEYMDLERELAGITRLPIPDRLTWGVKPEAKELKAFSDLSFSILQV